MTELHCNDRGIALKYETSKSEIQFLDLNIKIMDGNIITSTFFKETDSDSFININSCHHAAWLKSVPKSTFLRLKRNCTNRNDFLHEASML